jgi:hypothetical protein
MMSQDGEGGRRRWVFKRPPWSYDTFTGGGVITGLILSLIAPPGSTTTKLPPSAADKPSLRET